MLHMLKRKRRWNHRLFLFVCGGGCLLPPAGNFLPFVPPAAHFSQQLEKWAKAHTVVSADFQPHCGVKIGTLPRNHLASFATGGASAVSAKNQWFLDFLSLQELRSLWDVVGIDSATVPLPLPLRRRKYYVYRRGIRIPTTSLRTACTVVSADFQPRCGVKVGTLS